MKYILITAALVLAFILGFVGFREGINLQGIQAQNQYDTTTGGFTASTSTVNTTSTQVFSSINRIAYITNTTGSQITCSLDPAGMTAVSSTVTSGRGVIIGPAYLTTSSFPNVAAFGECHGQAYCFPHKGAVNCLAGAAITIDKLVQ